MIAAEATVQTEHASRYLVRLCSHVSKISGRRGLPGHGPAQHTGGAEPTGGQPTSVEWSGTHGVIALPWGECTLRATAGLLWLRAEAGTEDGLQRIRDTITARLASFSRRDPLTVDWHRVTLVAARPGTADGLGPAPQSPAPGPKHD